MQKKNIKKYKPSNNFKVNNPFKFIPRQLTETFNFQILSQKFDKLNSFFQINENMQLTIDFKDTKSLAALNEAIMSHYFNIQGFLLPEGNMQPCIGNRINYMNWVNERIKTQQNKVCIDFGTGCSGIYLLIGARKFKWQCFGLEKQKEFLENAKRIIDINKLNNQIELIQGNQIDDQLIEIIKQKEGFKFVVCNPPFYDNFEDKQNMSQISEMESHTDGGEVGIIKHLYESSLKYKNEINLFTSLIGREKNFEEIIKFFINSNEKNDIKIDVITGKLYQGQNVRFVIAWSIKQQTHIKEEQKQE